jgi:hypothetical protein
MPSSTAATTRTAVTVPETVASPRCAGALAACSGFVWTIIFAG